MRSAIAGGALAAGLAMAGLAVPSAQAATFAVNNTNNSGAGSLRSAINAAEGTAAPDVIRFAIPGAGPHTITLTSSLPVITRPLTIRGYSQAGSAAPTANTPADIRIVLDASAVARGLDIGGDDVEVRGLKI